MGRERLFNPPIINSTKYLLLEGILKVIESKIEESADYKKEIQAFHKASGKENFYTHYNFENYWRGESKDDFINEILLPEPPKVENITYNEILGIVLKFQTGEIKFVSYYIKLLTLNTNYPYVHDLIFWPNTLGYDLHLAAERIAKVLFKNEKPPKDMLPPIIEL